MLELIIEKGMQILQTTEGEKLPRVIETMVRQFAAEPGQCQFTMYVGEPGLCKYDDLKKRIITPGGLPLRGVEVLKHKPSGGPTIPAMVLCKCTVAFHYNTNHKAHYINAIAN
jgi:hypothetical protein